MNRVWPATWRVALFSHPCSLKRGHVHHVRWLCAFGLLLLAACGALPAPPAMPALHDFGPPPAGNAASATPATPATAATPATPASAIVIDAVTAPSWLADAQIHYRLLFDEPTRLRAYAQNLWVAPPAELLRQRLLLAFDRSDKPAKAPQTPVYRLQLRLLEFEQVFASPSSASVRLRALVSLRTADDRVLDRRLFSISVATSPDVQGALQGGPEAVDRLLGQVMQWSGREQAGTPARRSAP